VLRVLVIDDAPSFRTLLRYLLPEEGDMEVVGEAAEVAEGLRLAAELQPDVVLTDVHLGAESGLDAIDELRAAGGGARVVVLSGTSGPEREAEALARGADAFLEKGADPAALRKALRGL
jgi:DNA-binding NarL/FixJ family response regulator